MEVLGPGGEPAGVLETGPLGRPGFVAALVLRRAAALAAGLEWGGAAVGRLDLLHACLRAQFVRCGGRPAPLPEGSESGRALGVLAAGLRAQGSGEELGLVLGRRGGGVGPWELVSVCTEDELPGGRRGWSGAGCGVGGAAANERVAEGVAADFARPASGGRGAGSGGSWCPRSPQRAEGRRRPPSRGLTRATSCGATRTSWRRRARGRVRPSRPRTWTPRASHLPRSAPSSPSRRPRPETSGDGRAPCSSPGRAREGRRRRGASTRCGSCRGKTQGSAPGCWSPGAARGPRRGRSQPPLSLALTRGARKGRPACPPAATGPPVAAVAAAAAVMGISARPWRGARAGRAGKGPDPPWARQALRPPRWPAAAAHHGGGGAESSCSSPRPPSPR